MNALSLLAQRGNWPDFRGANIVWLALIIIGVLGLAAVVFAVAKALKVPIPEIVITLAWICFVVLMGVAAVIFIASLL